MLSPSLRGEPLVMVTLIKNHFILYFYKPMVDFLTKKNKFCSFLLSQKGKQKKINAIKKCAFIFLSNKGNHFNF
jgi:hypothetical protein